MAYVQGKPPDELEALATTDLDPASDLILVWDASAHMLKYMTPAQLGIYTSVQSVYELDAASTTTTEAELLTAADARLTLANNSTYAYEGLIVAMDSTQAIVYGEEISGMIKRVANAASTVFIGSPYGSIRDGSTSTVSTRQAADTTNGALGIFGTNSGGTALTWKAYIKLYRVA
jgi:hypothetical protein